MASISPFASKITCARADTHTCGCAAAFCARPATKTAVKITLEQKRPSMKSPSAAPFAKQSPAADHLPRGRLYDRASLAEERRRWNVSRRAIGGLEAVEAPTGPQSLASILDEKDTRSG
jgi:hypothetical protein